MQDQTFMHEWNAGHDRFSADLDRGLGHIIGHFSRRDRPGSAIGSSYELLTKYEAPRAARPALSPAAQASLRGFAASVITFALWVTVMALATPAPGLAAPLDAPTAPAAECVAGVALA